MIETEDKKILTGIIAGDETVIKSFYKNNIPYIKGYVLKNSGNEQDVEDVFQDAIVFVYQKFKTDPLDIRYSLKTYFYAVCKNIWRNRLRKNKRLQFKEEPLMISEITEQSIQEELEKKEQESLYRKYFLQLGDRCLEVLNLVFEGKSMREISTITGYSEGYARKKKFECKKRLLEMIENDPMYDELRYSNTERS
ncbi:RNA polymerase sigma factor [Aquimarina hainanensis]|uniref:RNA polymerase sigma factor n=1 Tax=Aquimarina hainanensis TaxID=1578017 RepID=A0ABW5NBX7_9FLAO|nr:sigma-70 family RNA polymerase sigma factor [Aquimarina sp. TRL1]QKX06990.1 sigma-70 family RNA polymerase sigma factor [Aquimarina sp. TRL1]